MEVRVDGRKRGKNKQKPSPWKGNSLNPFHSSYPRRNKLHEREKVREKGVGGKYRRKK